MALAEIHALRQIADAMNSQSKMFADSMASTTRAMERLADKMEDVDRRLIRVEEAKHGRDIERLTKLVEGVVGRVASIEDWRNKAIGAGNMVTWLRTTAPWVMAIILGAVLVFDRVSVGR